MKNLLILLIVSYRKYISPLFAGLGFSRCRFSKTCSEFAIDAIREQGTQKGILLSLKRLTKCQPFGEIYG